MPVLGPLGLQHRYGGDPGTGGEEVEAFMFVMELVLDFLSRIVIT